MSSGFHIGDASSFLTSASNFNIEPNSGVFDISPENDRASPNVKPPSTPNFLEQKNTALHREQFYEVVSMEAALFMFKEPVATLRTAAMQLNNVALRAQCNGMSILLFLGAVRHKTRGDTC